MPLTSVRRTIARRLTEAWTIPVFQLVISVDMDAVNQLVERRRELDPEERVTVTDVLVKVCAAALMRHREVNVQFTDEELLVFPYANVGIAVAHRAGARRAGDARRGASLAGRGRRRARRRRRPCARGRAPPEDLEGGTFTISNLGMFGLDSSRPCSTRRRRRSSPSGRARSEPVVRDGEIVARPTMTMTLTCDHRAVDGAPAAEFLETVKAMLEDLSLAL